MNHKLPKAGDGIVIYSNEGVTLAQPLIGTVKTAEVTLGGEYSLMLDQYYEDIPWSFALNEVEWEFLEYADDIKIQDSYAEFASKGGTIEDYAGVPFNADTLGFTPTNDSVNHPNHYNYGDIEVIDFIEQVADAYQSGSIAYCLGNVIKYVARAPFKNGKEDLKKAAFYLNKAIENY